MTKQEKLAIVEITTDLQAVKNTLTELAELAEKINIANFGGLRKDIEKIINKLNKVRK
jgi:hypothetical protein